MHEILDPQKLDPHMQELDPHHPRSLTVGVAAHKQVILIRHGQSMANAAGAEAEADHQSLRWLDAPVTELGRTQASSWAGVAPTWQVEEVWCSPLVRAMETACRIFQQCEVPIYVTPYAREGWIDCSENRGRLGPAITAGTDGVSDEQRWPRVADLPGAHKLRGLERVEHAIPHRWDPATESSSHADVDGLFALWRESVEELKKELMASKAHRIALVCHWGVIEALTGVDCENCTVVPCVARVAVGGSLVFSVCPPIVTHPPLGERLPPFESASPRRRVLVDPHSA
jgi:broad specificity phosphatase PhoE